MCEGPSVLTIHATDNRGEEGILADAAVFRELRCTSVAVVTSILAACSGRMDALEPISPTLVGQQIESVMKGNRPVAARTGILADVRQIELVADLVQEYGINGLVVAPVLRYGGAVILDQDGLDATRRLLFPQARVVIVRAGDLQAFAGDSGDGIEAMREAAGSLREQGARAVLIAGFISRGRALDLLDDDGSVAVFDTTRIVAPRVSGLASAHAAALTAHLARGEDLMRAVAAAQRFIGFRLQRG